jgi:hypothetical protein
MNIFLMEILFFCNLEDAVCMNLIDNFDSIQVQSKCDPVFARFLFQQMQCIHKFNVLGHLIQLVRTELITRVYSFSGVLGSFLTK